MVIILVIVATCVFVVLYKIRNAGRKPMNYPPGPPTLPIIGNLHQLPASQPHLQFKKWADEYGPVYSLMLGASVTIVLSSDVAIKDLLDKRSHIYSSRPPFYIGQILSGRWRMLLMVSMQQPLFTSTLSDYSLLLANARAGVRQPVENDPKDSSSAPKY
jgi:hypothetical protein